MAGTRGIQASRAAPFRRRRRRPRPGAVGDAGPGHALGEDRRGGKRVPARLRAGPGRQPTVEIHEDGAGQVTRVVGVPSGAAVRYQRTSASTTSSQCCCHQKMLITGPISRHVTRADDPGRDQSPCPGVLPEVPSKDRQARWRRGDEAASSPQDLVFIIRCGAPSPLAHRGRPCRPADLGLRRVPGRGLRRGPVHGARHRPRKMPAAVRGRLRGPGRRRRRAARARPRGRRGGRHPVVAPGTAGRHQGGPGGAARRVCVLLACCSVKGQVDAVRRALQRPPRTSPTRTRPPARTPAEIRDRLHARLADAGTPRPPAARERAESVLSMINFESCRSAASSWSANRVMQWRLGPRPAG